MAKIPVEKLLSQAMDAAAPVRASTRLKSRIYSALMREEAATGPIRSLAETKAEGRDLCIFEQLIRIAPVGESVRQFNYCRICHARILGEHLENPPLYWNGCPYAEFNEE